MADTCPTLEHILDAEQCFENFAGLASTVYVGRKSDLAAPLTATDNLYSEPTFKPGKGLFRIDAKEETVKIEGSSLGNNNGYKLQIDFTIDMVNKLVSKVSRSLNNLRDLFFIVQDGEDWQILYDPQRKCKVDADGIKSTTGAAAADDRNTTVAFILQPVKYDNLYVTITDSEKLVEGYTE